MNSKLIHRWLKQQVQREMAINGVLAILSLLLGVVIMLLTFWVALLVITLLASSIDNLAAFGLNHSIMLPMKWRLWGAGIFMVLLFWDHLRMSPHWRGDWSSGAAGPLPGKDPLTKTRNALLFAQVVTNLTPLRSSVGKPLGRARGVLALGQLLTHSGVSSRIIAEILETGPRLLTCSWNFLRKIRQLAMLDHSTCGWVLEVLATRENAATFAELLAAWPELDLPQVMENLPLLRGVVVLEKGLSLTDELQTELRQLQ